VQSVTLFLVLILICLTNDVLL